MNQFSGEIVFQEVPGMIRHLIIALFVSFFVSFSAMAQDAKLIEAAKKESGAIIAYGSLESNTVEPIIEAFRQRTGLNVEYWRASATKVMDRALAELRAGKSVFDVMSITAAPFT